MKKLILIISLLFSFSCFSQTAKFLVLAQARQGYEIGDIITKQGDVTLGKEEKLPVFLCIKVINCHNDINYTVPLTKMQGDTMQVIVKNHKYKISETNMTTYLAGAVNSEYDIPEILQDAFFNEIVEKSE